jgi:site-specific recombinase XerD
MIFRVVQSMTVNNAQSPFRVVDQSEHEIPWINRFLDRQRIRGVADTTLRSYAYDLLNFLRWWAGTHGSVLMDEGSVSESTLLDYIRFQAAQNPPPAPASINRRLTIAERVLRLECPNVVTQAAPDFQHWYRRRSPLGIGRWRPALSQLRVRAPKRVITPLTVEQVARFWHSFRNSRDLSIVGLMVLHGLRSREVLALNVDDLLTSDSRIHVTGKGAKVRILPLATDSMRLLDDYLRLERPAHCGAALFVSLKGPARGRRMTPAGLRSLFRHHRYTADVRRANPHRFRHTFASDMLAAGVSLPALMQLMGHANIQTTLIYVQVTPQDVYDQYARAVATQVRRVPPIES